MWFRTVVDNNSFREDLLFRLNVFPISFQVEQCSEDIPDLLDHFHNKNEDEIIKKPADASV